MALATAALIMIPFALWHPGEFAAGAVWSHLAEPGRGYALNLLAWPTFQLDGPLIIVLPAALLVGAWTSRRFLDDDRAWLAGSAGLLLFAFAFNRVAFVNYYSIPLVLILQLLLVLACPPLKREASPEAVAQAAARSGHPPDA